MFTRSVLSRVGHRASYTSSRFISTSRVSLGQAFVFNKHGDPSEVLSLDTDYNVEVKKGQVEVKMLHAAVNLTDLAAIRGKDAPAASFPGVPGDEGLGVVKNPGDSSFRVGDYVIPARPGLGTWRSELACDASDLIAVRNDIQSETAACISVSPITAFRLLEDFVTLKEGDVIIQNGGSGVVAQTVNQLCAQRGIKVINVVRQRGIEEYGDIVERSKKDGAYITLSEEYLQTPRFKELISDLPAPKLALNCSGGVSATNLARLLGEGGTMVSYGNVSNDSVFIPTSLLIFKDIQLRAFNFNQWLSETSAADKKAMVDKVANMVWDGDLHIWVEAFDAWDYNTVLTEMNYPKNRKLLLSLHDNPLETKHY